MAMLLLSTLCALIVINFRSWIIQYGNCAEAVGKLFVIEKVFDNEKDIAAFLAVNSRKERDGIICHSIFPFIATPLFCIAYLATLIVTHFFITRHAQSRPKELTWIVRFNDIKKSSKIS